MQKISRDTRNIIVLFIIVKLLIFLIGYIGFNVVAFSYPYYERTYVFQETGMWDNWDGQWYLKIATEGYGAVSTHKDDIKSRSFFPFYPLLIWLLGHITGKATAGLIISNTASFIGAVYLYKLLRKDFNREIGEKTVFYTLIFPTALFFSVIYTESLFFMFTVMALFYVREQKWWASGLCSVCSSLTRVVGAFIFVPLLIEYTGFTLKEEGMLKVKRKPDWDIVWILISPLGTLVYFTYLELYTGNFFAFFEGQLSFRSCSVARLPMIIIETFSKGYIHYPHFSMIDIFTAFVFVFMLYFVFKRTRMSYFVYSAYIVLVPLLSGSFMSMPRMVLVSFPHFIVFATWGKNNLLNIFLVLLFSMLLGLATVMFVNHYWVA